MKLGLRHIALLFLTAGCSSANYSPVVACDAGTDSAPAKELVCAQDFCGKIVDKNTGATADCGSCPSYSQCGDNGIANVCGSSCMPLTNKDQATYGKYNTAACDYYFGSGWYQGYGVGMQFPPTCNYTNADTCVAINVPTNNKPCGGDVCGHWICCVDNPDAGYPALLPGAVASNDGGLP